MKRRRSRVWPGMTDLQQKIHAEVGHTEYVFGGDVLCRPRNRKTSQADVGDDITRACPAITMAGQAGGTALDLELQARDRDRSGPKWVWTCLVIEITHIFSL